MGELAWICSALITGMWAAIHVFVFLDAISIIKQSAAVIFTLSLIATLFLHVKLPKHQRKEKKRKEKNLKLKIRK